MPTAHGARTQGARETGESATGEWCNTSTARACASFGPIVEVDGGHHAPHSACDSKIEFEFKLDFRVAKGISLCAQGRRRNSALPELPCDEPRGQSKTPADAADPCTDSGENQREPKNWTDGHHRGGYLVLCRGAARIGQMTGVSRAMWTYAPCRRTGSLTTERQQAHVMINQIGRAHV